MKIAHATGLAERFYPEKGAGGFSRVDGSIAFFTRIRALLRPTSRVLDFGAGRGWHIVEDPVPFRRACITLRGSCAKVVGVDVDEAVRENPGLDEAHVVEPGASLPFADASFDLIVCDHVFEHLVDPATTAAELTRVLAPGGWI
ncbi:MAG: class I SAM-dependent methyltransferase, partial [Candidatus Binatia bacterium]